jgi:peptidyl-prolyl cis-trans isomerase B (cyclophilin B)
LKKILAAITAAAITLSLSGCLTTTTNNAMENYDFAAMNTDFVQLKSPEEGDTIAIIDTDYGEVRVVLYEEYAPNTVAAFIENAENGVYDNMPVYGVMTDVYFLTGGHENEKGTYIGRTSDDELIENECTVDLWPFTGALVAFSEETGYSDSRWFICNTDKDSLTQESIDELKESAQQREDETERENLITLFDKFYEVGGVFGVSGYETVFGQTYEGMDVVEKLCNIPVEDNNRTSVDVMIKSVTISQYHTDEE